jgi:antitoxin HicB
MSKNKHNGTSLDQFLIEEGLLIEVEALAIKKILAKQIEQTMQERDLSKTKMAQAMHTSRAAINRLLDEQNTSITLITMVRAAEILDKKLICHLQKKVTIFTV